MLDDFLDFPGLRASAHQLDGVARVRGQALDNPDQFELPRSQRTQGPLPSRIRLHAFRNSKRCAMPNMREFRGCVL